MARITRKNTEDDEKDTALRAWLEPVSDDHLRWLLHAVPLIDGGTPTEDDLITYGVRRYGA